MTDKPGRELPKDFRAIAAELVDNQGWTYRLSNRGGHPMLFPADKNQPPIPVPTSPSDVRGIKNFRSQIRRRGGNV